MKPLRKWQIALEFDATKRERAYLKLAAYLRTGVKLSDALDMLWRFETEDGKKSKSAVAQVLGAWRRGVANGRSFADAIQGTVPPSDYVIIKAGDESGRLDAALADAVYITKARKKMVGAILGGLAYPVLLVNMIVLFFAIFTTSVLPSFEEIMPREQWFGFPAMLADVADMSVTLAPIVAVVVFTYLVASLWSLPRWSGRLRTKMEILPPWSIYKTLQGSGFLISLAALIKSGVKLPDALKILSFGASPWLRSRLSAIQRQVSNGLSLGDAMYRTRLDFPSRDIVLDMRAYSNMDGFEEALERVGREWIDDSVVRIKKDFDAIKNALIILFGLVFIAIASGIFTLQDMVTTSFALQR